MRRKQLAATVLLVLASAGMGTTAHAAGFYKGTIKSVTKMPVGVQKHGATASSARPRGVDDLYSNLDTFTGYGGSFGTSAVSGGVRYTRLICDDLTFDQGTGGTTGNIDSLSFSFGDLNSSGTHVASPGILFYAADGATGTPQSPGTFLAGYQFDPLSFDGGYVYTIDAELGTPLNLTSGTRTIWACVQASNAGGSSITQTQLQSMAIGYFDPPDLGSSTNLRFITTNGGDFTGTNSPAGSRQSGTTFNYNVGWYLNGTKTTPVTVQSFSVD